LNLNSFPIRGVSPKQNFLLLLKIEEIDGFFGHQDFFSQSFSQVKKEERTVQVLRITPGKIFFFEKSFESCIFEGKTV